jgi:hypothetical protein
MGCHTWFHIPIIPQPTYEEVKQDVIDNYCELKFWNDVINGNLDEDFIKIYPEFLPEYGKSKLLLHTRIKQVIEKGLCREAVCRRYSKDSRYYNGMFYESINGFNGLFRVPHYPEDVLTSFEETIDFIKRNKDKVYGNMYETNYVGFLDKLTRFFGDNPGGIIDFG